MNISGVSNRTMLGRILRLPLRMIPSRMCLPILQGPAKGFRWVVGTSDHAVWLGSYEYHKQRLFADMIKPGNIVYDVGAHAGFYSLLAARQAGDKGHVYAFEPSRSNCESLRKHLELNHQQNVVLVETAVSDFVGQSHFGCGVSSSTNRIDETGVDTVAVTTLDTFWRALPAEQRNPAVIKIDVEGAEVHVLRGAKTMLETARPFIFLATHSIELKLECEQLLAEMNYRLRPVPDLADDELLAEPSDR